MTPSVEEAVEVVVVVAVEVVVVDTIETTPAMKLPLTTLQFLAAKAMKGKGEV